MFVHHFSRENYEKVDTVANLAQITEIRHLLREVQDQNNENLRVSIQRDGYAYSRGVLTVKRQTIVEGTDNGIEAFLVNDGVRRG